MKILYITNSPIEYNSSANIRNISLIKGLVENGHQVEVLSCFPNKGSKYYDPTNTCKIDVPVKYIESVNKLSGSELKINKNEKSYVFDKVRVLLYKLYNSINIYDPRVRNLKYIDDLHIDNSYNVIISSSDPKSSHLLAENIIKKLGGVKWIQYWGDPMAADINKKGIIPKCFLKREELRLLRMADVAIYVSPTTCINQKKEYEKVEDKLHYLPIPVIPDTFTQYVKHGQEDIRLGYYGDYYLRDRNIIPLVNVCRKNKYYLDIYGNSDLTLEKTQYVNVNSRVTYKKIKTLEEQIDVLVCLCNKAGGQIPGKIYHYAATYKPILLILDGENKDDIQACFKKYPNYFMCENNEKSITEAVEAIMRDNRSISPVEDFFSMQVAQKMIEIVMS